MCSNRGPNWTQTKRPTSQNSSHNMKDNQNNTSLSSTNQNSRSIISSNPITSKPFQSRSWQTERRNMMPKEFFFHFHQKFTLGNAFKSPDMSLREITEKDLLDNVDKVNAIGCKDATLQKLTLLKSLSMPSWEIQLVIQ